MIHGLIFVVSVSLAVLFISVSLNKKDEKIFQEFFIFQKTTINLFNGLHGYKCYEIQGKARCSLKIVSAGSPFQLK